ncbi:Asp/Glu/hydantoin racemase [Biscogniauxia mediterranea]|nr:Asp/Glu/hydantoin racemase [Biscogniauxia mediterranea]
MATTLVRGRATKILILNPNSSQAMTDSLRPAINDVDLPYSTEIHTYTAPPRSPASINDGEDIQASTAAVVADLANDVRLASYDGVLVACFSVHPLVPALQQSPPPFRGAVTGIFEASVVTALSLLAPGQKWGIVTTGAFWEAHLSDGVRAFLNGSSSSDLPANFAGVASTGLHASDFHDEGGVGPAVVEAKLREATRRLLRGGHTACIVMGCAGMAGLERTIREAAREELGEQFAYGVLHVVDGVRAGLMQIDNMIKLRRLRPGIK